MPRQSDAKIRLVATAARLFQRQGYHGTGLAQVLDESGAPKGSFYHHFPGGKEALAATTVTVAGGEVTRWVEAAFQDAESWDAGVDRLAQALADWFEGSGWAAGCPITSVLLETVPDSPTLRQACAGVLEDWAEVASREARRHGRPEADSLGLALVMAMEGAWITARASQSREPFALAARMVKGLGRPSD